MTNKTPFPTVNPSAAILLDQITVSVTANLKTGMVQVQTSRPNMKDCEIADLLNTGVQIMIRQHLVKEAAASGKPVPGGIVQMPGETPGGNSGGNTGAAS
jgi:hypothetical protein